MHHIVKRQLAHHPRLDHDEVIALLDEQAVVGHPDDVQDARRELVQMLTISSNERCPSSPRRGS